MLIAIKEVRGLVAKMGQAALVTLVVGTSYAQSIAREWNEEILAAIREDFPNPAVHARNLHHLSTAIYAAWAAYDSNAVGYLYHERASAADLPSARRETISFAAYRVLRTRYAGGENASGTLARLDAKMAVLDYDIENTSTIGSTPSALGNRIADHILTFSLADGSNEAKKYLDPSYSSVNDPLVLLFSGTTMKDPNRWQPLAFDVAFTQNGLVADKVQKFVASHWNDVRPFNLTRENESQVYFDPGAPPYLGGQGDDLFKEYTNEVIRASAALDPNEDAMIEISPGGWGNNTLGENDGKGRALNPVTGSPYESNLVKRADFHRVLAEFWADGPDSETPPGHWNVLANEVSDSLPELRFGGVGPEVDRLEWDVKLYFTLNAAVHDVAVAVWGCKRHYDYVRPISAIRFMGEKGQSSDPGLPAFDTLGLKLEDGLVELITDATAAPGQRHAHLSEDVGKIAIFAWAGEPENPETEFGGSAWILPADWMPYQKSTFVTPAFAGYVSGHSGFSRAAAEVMTTMTGSPFFPDGLGSHTAEAESLEFESGPSTPVTLQWATYFDAADQAGISRIYGGIHFACDDGPGRIVGAKCGQASLERSQAYFDGSILDQPVSLTPTRTDVGGWELRWPSIRGLYYKVQTSSDLRVWTDLDEFRQAGEEQMIREFSSENNAKSYYRLIRQAGTEE